MYRLWVSRKSASIAEKGQIFSKTHRFLLEKHKTERS